MAVRVQFPLRVQQQSHVQRGFAHYFKKKLRPVRAASRAGVKL